MECTRDAPLGTHFHIHTGEELRKEEGSGAVVHSCNPSYLGGGNQEDGSSRSALAKS
jgi:hypothetical protein